MSDSPYIPTQSLTPPPPRASVQPGYEQAARRRSSRIAAQRKEIRSNDLCSTGSAAKNDLLKRTSRSKASSKRSVSSSSAHRIPVPIPPNTGLALTEDNLLAHTSLTNNTPHAQGTAQSIQLGNQAQDNDSASTLSLDSEDIKYYVEKLRCKRVSEVKPEEPAPTNPIIINNSDADNLTTPQLIEKMDSFNPGWQGAQTSSTELQEILNPDGIPPHIFDPSLPQPASVYQTSPNTPPNNKFINLDLETTPQSPAVIRANAEMVDALKRTDTIQNPFHTTTEQQIEEFETSVIMSKVTTDHIINSNFARPSTPTPAFPNKEPLSFEEITHIRELWSELATYYAMLRPEFITNSHALAEPAYAFIKCYQESVWCDITVGTTSARKLYTSTPAPIPTSAPSPSHKMDTDEDHSAPAPSSNPIPTAPTSVPNNAPAPTADVQAPSTSDFPTLNAAHIKLLKSPIKVGRPKPFANLTPKAIKKPVQPPKGIMEGPKSSILPRIDALGTQKPNAATPKPTLIPPTPTPTSKGKLSYAQATTNVAQNMPFTEASMKFIASLDSSLPNDIKETIIRSLPRVSPPKPSPKPINPKSIPTPKTVAISKGPSRKSAIFALDGTLHATMLTDLESITSGMNVYLNTTASDIRVETGRLTNSKLHLNLNLVPNASNFQYIRLALIQVLCLHDIPEDALIPYSPQSEAHLIIKGLDYYTTPYSTRPEDVLTGEQVVEKLANNPRLDGLSAVRTPRVIKSKGSNDMAVVFLDVWDSQNGINTKDIVNKVYHVCSKLICIEYARPREFIPQCQKCWAWTHGTKACRLNHHRCPKCNGGHKEENHNLFAECCNEDRKKNNGIISNCTHESKCRNCGESHAANDFSCIYNLNKHNKKWHADKVAENRLKRNSHIKAALTSASPSLPSA